MSDPVSRREEKEKEEEKEGEEEEETAGGEPDVESVPLRQLSASKLDSGGDSVVENDSAAVDAISASATSSTSTSTSAAATSTSTTSTAVAASASATSGAPERPSALSVKLHDDDDAMNNDVLKSGGGSGGGGGGSVSGGGGGGSVSGGGSGKGSGSGETKLSPFEEWDIEENAGELRKKSVAIQDAKEAAIQRLQEELHKSKETLKLRDVQVEKLSRIRDEMGAELEELTASLFEEAHKMVHDANVKRASAEKLVAEANLKIEVLSAEVVALKALVLTSTPSTPNRGSHHHHNQNITPSPERKSSTQGSSPNKSLVNGGGGGHKRAASHGGISVGGGGNNDNNNSGLNSSFIQNARSSFGAGSGKSGISTSTPSPSTKLNNSSVIVANDADIPLPHPCPKTPSSSSSSEGASYFSNSIKREQIDPIAFEEFSDWIENPALDSTTPFLARIFAEDIRPCFNFSNKELAASMLTAIEANSIVIEPLLTGASATSTSLPRSSAAYGGRKCALSLLSKICNYKIRLEDVDDVKMVVKDGVDSSATDAAADAAADAAETTMPTPPTLPTPPPPPTWHFVSDFCRNRVIAVCDFYTYIRYIVQGLVKKKSDDAHETFCHINRLRRNMNLARLGFQPQELL